MPMIGNKCLKLSPFSSKSTNTSKREQWLASHVPCEAVGSNSSFGGTHQLRIFCLMPVSYRLFLSSNIPWLWDTAHMVFLHSFFYVKSIHSTRRRSPIISEGVGSVCTGSPSWNRADLVQAWQWAQTIAQCNFWFG